MENDENFLLLLLSPCRVYCIIATVLEMLIFRFMKTLSSIKIADICSDPFPLALRVYLLYIYNASIYAKREREQKRLKCKILCS